MVMRLHSPFGALVVGHYFGVRSEHVIISPKDSAACPLRCMIKSIGYGGCVCGASSGSSPLPHGVGLLLRHMDHSALVLGRATRHSPTSSLDHSHHSGLIRVNGTFHSASPGPQGDSQMIGYVCDHRGYIVFCLLPGLLPDGERHSCKLLLAVQTSFALLCKRFLELFFGSGIVRGVDFTPPPVPGDVGRPSDV